MKKIWIINHYAYNGIINKRGRHFNLAKHLVHLGYEPYILCSSILHNSYNFNKKNKFKENITLVKEDGVKYIVIKSFNYNKSALLRIINILYFTFNLFFNYKKISKIVGKPDTIIGSSFHPFSMILGNYISKKFNVQSISEIRDLWPETFFAYKNSKLIKLFSKVLYNIEHKIYYKSDKLIFTMEGGKKYILDKEWDKSIKYPIDLNKVYHLNNGVSLKDFDKMKITFKFNNEYLDNSDIFKVVYTGAIGIANKVDYLLDIAKRTTDKKIIYLIFGKGLMSNYVKDRIDKENIKNCKYIGWVESKYIPNILSKSDLNIILGDSIKLTEYGVSLNKLFEYFAAGKPILATYKFGYPIINKYNAGIEIENFDIDEAILEINKIKNMSPDEYNDICKNSLIAANDYDYENLAKQLVDIIEK